MNIQQNQIKSSQHSQPHNIFQTQDNTVAIYTVLSILIKMKNRFGLEAMTQYIQSYLDSTEIHYPGIKPAVHRALDLMSVERIYREAM